MDRPRPPGIVLTRPKAVEAAKRVLLGRLFLPLAKMASSAVPFGGAVEGIADIVKRFSQGEPAEEAGWRLVYAGLERHAASASLIFAWLRDPRLASVFLPVRPPGDGWAAPEPRGRHTKTDCRFERPRRASCPPPFDAKEPPRPADRQDFFSNLLGGTLPV